MEPLKSAKVNEMSELDLKDIIQEGQGLHEAIQDFEEQFEEVRDMLKGLTIERRDTVRKLQGDDEKGWKGGRKGF
ncbi:hypothetical protein BU25DRAFT_409188 [Macroventuria anomochaeta]|uniref:Uncharacterized protein n=1 Tax=Macroventuria anomochaeta TaxID=301207 RepID=A0ACB6S5Q4_9PLEO|nr:uncharacterized protein BU25DRAFT_409188 [Macroventuria anomochaeta]KAF2629293.1 hypothetical protein BU25DRAFT_409188 [Macroventuria anomochaeta]